VRTTTLICLLIGSLSVWGCGSSSNPDTVDSGVDQPDSGTNPIPLGDILDELNAVDGITFVEEYQSEVAGYRAFHLLYEQPVDHDNPTGAKFSQMMTLLHRSYDAPTVLATTGYWNYLYWRRTEPTRLLSANQLVTEQRFFAGSRPDPADWDKLRIRQAAADHHRIVTALKQRIYSGNKWLSTGASKGGMTSIYHKRFHPEDIDAVIAYVAPISFGAPDDRYQAFFDTVGDATCRQRLHDFQRMALTRRDEIKPMFESVVAQESYVFTWSGGLDTAIEDEIAGLEWSFWQYMGVGWCGSIPQAGASASAIYDFIDEAGGIDYSADRYVDLFLPYYFQAEVELGYPGYEAAYVQDLLLHSKVKRADPMPAGFERTFDSDAMSDVQDWVNTDGNEILYVYGEYDPWTAGEFAIGAGTNGAKFVAAQATHGASIGQLSSTDQAAVFGLIEQWTGLEASFPQGFAAPQPRMRTPRPPAWMFLRRRAAR